MSHGVFSFYEAAGSRFATTVHRLFIGLIDTALGRERMARPVQIAQF
jgi:hypothetical protein